MTETHVPLIVTSISVIGNIGSGKTTLTRGIADDPDSNFRSVEEPVRKWSDSGVLGQFYERTIPNIAYVFQQLAFIDRITAFRETYFDLVCPLLTTLRVEPTSDTDAPSDPYLKHRMTKPTTRETLRVPRVINIVTDNHVVVDRWVFASHLNDTGDIPDDLMKHYVDTFDNWVKLLPCYRPQIVLYLKSTSSTCFQRKHARGRTQEKGVDVRYLQSLHEKFESVAKNPSLYFGEDCNFVTLDADQPEDVVLQTAIEAISPSRS